MKANLELNTPWFKATKNAFFACVLILGALFAWSNFNTSNSETMGASHNITTQYDNSQATLLCAEDTVIEEIEVG